MGRRPTNNPRQIRSKSCGCSSCTAKFRPGSKPTRRDCIGSWQYRYIGPDGREKAINRAAKDEAIAAGEKAKVEARGGTWLDPNRSKISLAQWWEIWWPLQSGERNTQVRDEGLWRNHVRDEFGSTKLMSISHMAVQAWVNGLDGPLAPRSVTAAFRILSRMLAAAVRDRRIPFNPCDGVKLPTPHKKHPEDRRPPTGTQMRRIRLHLPPQYRVLQTVAQETGLRWGELAGLRGCWVDLENSRLQVREILEEVKGQLRRKEYPKSDAGMRTVPLTPRALGALRWLMEVDPPSMHQSKTTEGLCADELVFRGRNTRINGRTGRAPLRHSNFYRVWLQAIKDAGVARVTPRQLPDGGVRSAYWPRFHDQRHAFASKLASLGVPEVIVQEVLGHERAGAVTWLYTHAAADVAGQVLAALTDSGRGQRPHLRAVA